MKIKELKKDYLLVYEAALKNQELQGNKRDDSIELGCDKFNKGFTFRVTEEGYGFWDEIRHTQFHIAKNLQPHLFIKNTENINLWNIVI